MSCGFLIIRNTDAPELVKRVLPLTLACDEVFDPAPAPANDDRAATGAGDAHP